ncbi:MAG: hypothetical protein GW947_00340 [Candidatus Pacebacteria bacterium]|nr:hypothetical protein [Candidatus Paceibacterota bacterium]
MTKRPFFLITGDDSIRAPGIILLKRIVESFADFAIIATKDQKSAQGSGLSVAGSTWGTEIVDGCEAIWVDGTPSDAIYLAFERLERKPDLILSGVNLGFNNSNAIHRSGTIAAVVTAAQSRATPGIAFSLNSPDSVLFKNHEQNAAFNLQLLEYPGVLIRNIIEKALAYTFQPGSFWNVNFPTEPVNQLYVVPTGPGDYWKNHQIITDGSFEYVLSHKATESLPDCDTKFNNKSKATITPCRLTFTIESELEPLEQLFSNI